MDCLLITDKSGEIDICGKTNPFVGLTSDNQNYVIKHQNDEFSGYNLVSEFVSYYLGRIIGINIPEMKLGRISPIFVNEIGTELFLCSKYIKNCLPLTKVPSNKFEKDINIIKVLIFDILIMNYDRTFEDNLLFNVKDEKIYVIDHSHCFNGFKKLNKFKSKIDERILFNYTKFVNQISVSELEFIKIMSDFKKITPEILESIVESIPKEWNFPYGEDLKLFLFTRIELIDEIMQIIKLNLNISNEDMFKSK